MSLVVWLSDSPIQSSQLLDIDSWSSSKNMVRVSKLYMFKLKTKSAKNRFSKKLSDIKINNIRSFG